MTDRSTARRRRAASFAIALEEDDPIARREFLTRMSAAMALAGLGACTRAPREEIVPYVTQPREVRPGVARHYASTSVLDGYATGIVVESHAGRPTKIEGNPEHPASLGAAGAFEQASILSLYDPARARGVTSHGTSVAWEAFSRALTAGRWANDGGHGLHVLLEPTSSPAVVRLLQVIRDRYPRMAVWFQSGMTANAWDGARIAFGRVLAPRFELEHADVILALDADFLASGPSNLRHARQFADRRVLGATRLYAVEPLMTVTGANADHRLGVRASEVGGVAAAFAEAIGLRSFGSTEAEPHRRWIETAARDLLAHRGRAVVIAGEAQPPEVHALAHAMNAALGGSELADVPILEAGERSHGTTGLADALAAGEVDTLVVCSENPVYRSPRLAPLFARARQSAYLATHDDETARACTFVLGRAHPLESWGDARAFDGTVSIVQPLIDPLFEGRTELDVLGLLAPKPASGYELVRAARADAPWRTALKRGIVEGSAFTPVTAGVDLARVAAAFARRARAIADRIELVSRLDSHVHDGRFGGNAWLLELPAPITKLTWTNAATFSRTTAARLGITNGDEVSLENDYGASVKAVACVVPGQADDTAGLSLGWGRTQGPELGRGRGTDAFALALDPRLPPTGVRVAKTGARRDLPITQTQRHLEGRHEAILGKGASKKRLALYEPPARSSPWQWGMVIDLARCTGCSACMIACQAENNVPTVGPDNVVLNREMHWLRIDSYYLDAEEKRIAAQPMLCQHCESAPCEYVCPVNATVHSPDGLNEMVYNRCVGTRFCSNNCPYKVRRFNWFDFHKEEDATQQLVHNPDVTVRERGVMEKCTFCVQRLREWEIKTRRGSKTEPPRTACQQTCPTRAIEFGDLSNPSSEVRKLRESDRIYAALEELGTEPRVRYLTRIGNPNPEMP